jgi:glutathione S-transferase
MSITLYGAGYSVYTRIARLALEELGLDHEIVEVDIFDKASLPEDYAQRQPFSKIPALDHDGFSLYETDAIAFYLVEAFDGAALTPRDAKARARMRQVMRICDNYAYNDLVWGVFVPECESEESPDADALARAKRDLGVLEGLADESLNAAAPSLADIWLAAIIAPTELAPSGREALAACPKLTAWFDAFAGRPSMAATKGEAGR